MNTGRFVLASLVVWIVRTLLNWLFYGMLTAGEYQAIMDEHPGVFREVIPAYIATDLLVALVFTWLVVKAASCFGGGMAGAVKLGVGVALIAAVAGNLYLFYSLTVYSMQSMVIDSIYNLVLYAIMGTVAAAVYKPSAA